MGAVKTRQSAVSKIAVNTWTCYIKYESPSKFEKIEETTIEVFASTQVEEENNPQSDCTIIAAKKKPGLCLRSRHHHPRRPHDHRDYHPLRTLAGRREGFKRDNTEEFDAWKQTARHITLATLLNA